MTDRPTAGRRPVMRIGATSVTVRQGDSILPGSLRVFYSDE